MPTRRTYLQIVACLSFCVVTAQPSVSQDKPTKPTLSPPFERRAQVLVLGTFHFQDGGADDYKQTFKVYVLSATRQKEVADLIKALTRFRPTRIGVEWPAADQAKLDAAYQKYRGGQLELSANEIHQLGFRLAQQLSHERLFAIDAPARWYDPNVSTELLVKHADQNNQAELLKRAQVWISYFDRLTERDDELKTQVSIGRFLAHLNSPAQLRQTLGRYLVGQIEVGGEGDYLGADMRTAWYNRNIRIFSNVQRMAKTSDRVLVIIGQGHAPILRHLLENAPEYELVPVERYLK